LFGPFVLFVSGKIFRVDLLTFRKTFVSYLLIFLFSVLIAIVISMFNLESHSFSIIISRIAAFFFITVGAWVIKQKFETTIP